MNLSRTLPVLALSAAFAASSLPALAKEAGPNKALLEPQKLTATAPDKFKVKFTTGKGDFIVEVQRDLAPRGADRFFNLVKNGFYDEARFFRVVPGFVVQFGINASPEVTAKWKNATIDDDAIGKASNERGTLTFATAGPNTRTTQLFINYKDNTRLDAMGFTPFAKVVKGMEVVDKLNAEFREQPRQDLIENQGNGYLKKEFGKLDFIKKAAIVK
jgi:peptidyl-prolyl cis-trans isomerase A (cyclophilin A)